MAVILKSYDEPTDLIIIGISLDEGIKVLLDKSNSNFQTLNIKSSINSQEIRFYTKGEFTILTIEEFKKVDTNPIDKNGWNTYMYLIKNYTGNIELQVRDVNDIDILSYSDKNKYLIENDCIIEYLKIVDSTYLKPTLLLNITLGNVLSNVNEVKHLIK